MEDVFSQRLKELRQRHKVPQKRLATALGISPRAYRFYEANERHPDFERLILIADFFDVSIDYLVGRTNEPTMNGTRTSLLRTK